MKQPRINSQQARWLIYLTPYDFIIRHRPGLLNPADGPSRRPDYLAQKGPSLKQDNLLASRLVGSNSDLSKAVKLSKAAGPDLPLCEVAKMVIPCPLGDTTVDFRLCDTARPTLDMAVGSRPILAMVAGFKSFEN